MNITFSIKYKADWGQRLCISGSVVELGCWDESQAVELTPEGDDRWTCTVSVDGRRKGLAYYYLVKDSAGHIVRREWKRMHRLSIRAPFRSIYMHDHWIERPLNAPFYSSAFYDVIYRQNEQNICQKMSVMRSLELERVVLQIYAPTVPRDSRLYLAGATPKLGEWRLENALPMCYLGKGEWATYIDMDRNLLSSLRVEFKFFIADDNRQNVRWEEGDNRYFDLPDVGQFDAIYIAGLRFREPSYHPRFAGVVAPIFSLRGRQDWGIGDFGTLRSAIDWAEQAGLRVLQTLPINDTTFYRDWRDSYPYNGISVDALNPIFADLGALPPIKDPEAADLIAQAQRLATSPTVCYPEVQALKERYLWLHYRERGAVAMKKKPFRQFIQQQDDWLTPYVAFCILRDKFPGKSFDQWGTYSTYQPTAIGQLLDSEEFRERAGYYRYVQYLLSEQLLAVRAYAEERGILLKGDIPIGVAPHSVEGWVHSELFNTNLSAGAPPDDFAVDGQNWGFPTYRWDVMQQDGMLWWRRRFERMAEYFKAFRIDHILGFFRIWEIPRNQQSGLLGHFSPAKPYSLEEWCDMLSIRAEDLELWTFPLLERSALEGEHAELWEQAIQAGLLVQTSSERYLRLVTPIQSQVARLAHEHLGADTDITPLVELCKDVALLEDSHNTGLYHPRIALETSRLYKSWDASTRQLWDKISGDYYYVRHNELWRQTAMQRILPLLESTDMLVCAEDLGMIPAVVPEVLGELQILTLDLERMPKAHTPTGWTPMQTIPYISVCTTSTHDMPPMRLWWSQLSPERQTTYLTEQLGQQELDAQWEEQDVYQAILRQHLATDAMFAIVPLADLMAIDKRLHLQQPEDEQINHPENPAQRWEWRMPIAIEDLTEQYASWTEQLRSLLHDHRRD